MFSVFKTKNSQGGTGFLYRRNSHLKASSTVWDNFWLLNSFKNDEKCVLFGLKRCFYSWDLSIFVLIFGHAGKKGKIYFKIYDVTKWITSNYSTHIAKYLKKWRQSDNEIWSVNRIQLEKHFCWKSYTNCGEETTPRPFLKIWIWAYLWINSVKFYTLCFYCMSKWRAIKRYWN